MQRSSPLEKIVQKLKKSGQLLEVKNAVDPDLVLAGIQRRLYQAEAPAVLFTNVKGTRYPCLANLFGTRERAAWLFKDVLAPFEQLVDIVASGPKGAWQHPLLSLRSAWLATKSLPVRVPFPQNFQKISVLDLPQIRSWPKDGGAFVTLPQVYTDLGGIFKSNLGMYRIQISGNDYIPNQEVGLHYQINRGLGKIHQQSIQSGAPLKVSIFVGGHPGQMLAAVMPLPPNLSELLFAGMLSNRNFRYARHQGWLVSADADFNILGEVPAEDFLKPEGPFGDHLGYYSLQHLFPYMKVHQVFARPRAIWPFTVVGRPPQEDTQFGHLIHRLTQAMVPKEIPGVEALHAVDAAGVHPLLLAVGTERYTPYLPEQKPMEILIQANAILGFNQCSLAKYLWISTQTQKQLIHEPLPFLQNMLQRMDFRRDLHFQTETSIDTLDYSSQELNEGSKVIFAAAGPVIRSLATELTEKEKNALNQQPWIQNDFVFSAGILILKVAPYASSKEDLPKWLDALAQIEALAALPLILLVDHETAIETTEDFLWVAFTRTNPAEDIHGIKSFFRHKHWGCEGSLVLDARQKPWHAPVLEEAPETTDAIEKFLKPFGGAIP